MSANTKPQHSPGPWHRHARIGSNRWRITDADGHQVADVNHYNDDAEANADLIEVAPELLDIARAVLVDDLIPYLPAEFVARVRAAIAKVTGVQA